VKDGVDLANSSGEALKEIVQSIRKVTDVVADIAHASAEQSAGLEQINKALSQLDEITQQNSALVEENAATAKTLENQARSMDERTAYFRLRAEGGEAEPVPQPPAERQQASAPGTRPQQSSKTADAFGEAAVAAA
jgi:methyl-accepting chemotaxis protein